MPFHYRNECVVRNILEQMAVAMVIFFRLIPLLMMNMHEIYVRECVCACRKVIHIYYLI